MEIDISLYPDKDVYYPGEDIEAVFSVRGLSGENVEAIEVGFIGREIIKIGETIGRSRLTDERRNTIANYRYVHRPQHIDELERRYRFTIPENSPPSIHLASSAFLSSSSIKVDYELYVDIRRRLRPDYRKSKNIIVGLKPQFKDYGGQPPSLKFNGENIDFYMELSRETVYPGDNVRLFLKSRRLLKVRKIRVGIRSYAWGLCEKYGVKMPVFSYPLLELRPSDIPQYGRDLDITIPDGVPPTCKSRYWWTWTEIVFEFRGIVREILKLSREIPVNYKYLRPRKIMRYITCPWCSRSVPEDSLRCPFCNYNLAGIRRRKVQS